MRLRPLCLAFTLGLCSAGMIHAELQDNTSFSFNNMSYASNTTSAKIWQRQATRYVSGGSFCVRTGNKNIQLVSVSLPSINAGCGGIDMYLGAFLFVNSDQIMAFMRQMMVNAVDYFFDLALETTVPEPKAVEDFLRKTAADINRFNMSNCQVAKTMVGSVASLWEESQQNICQSAGGQKSVFPDWVAFRQECTSGSKHDSVVGKATDAEKDRILKDINLMQDALGNDSLSSNTGLRQFAMSISGSAILGNSGELRILSSVASNRSLLTTMMSGGMAKVYACDNQNKYLSPTLNNVTISADKPLIKVVQGMLTSTEGKTIIDTSLTEKEKQFINSISIPILSWIVDQSSLGISQSLSAQLTGYIAVDIYLQYLEAVMKVTNGPLAAKDRSGVNVKELKNGLSDAKQALNSLRTEIQIKEDVLISTQQQIRFIRQQVSSRMNDRVLGNHQLSRMN